LSIILHKTPEFEDWYADQALKTQLIVDARLQRIEKDNHWGTINTFDGLIELKWGSGMRIYTFKFGDKIVVILLGGNKNGQSKDIKQAKKLKAKIEENGTEEA
jgi:putative addiction module killer protein